MTDANPSTAAEDAAEQFIAAAIDRAPECARRLGEYLAAHLDDDNFGPADRMLLGLVEQMLAAAARAEKAEAERDAALRGALEFNAKVGAGFARDEEYLRLHREKMDEFHKRIAAESRVKMAERDRGALIAALDHLLYPKPASGTRVYTLPDGQRECLTAKQFNEACARQLLQTLATQDLLAMAPEVETAPDQPEDPAHD